MRLFRATFKVGALLNSQSLVMNIAHHIRVRLKHDVAGLDGALHFTVHNHLLSGDGSNDLGIRRDNERSALQVPLYLAIDFDCAICGDSASNLQATTDDCSSTTP